MEYYHILNLSREPFSNSPDPEFFFKSQQHTACLQKLEIAIRLKRGLNVVTGEVGTGKTTLCRQLIRHFSEDTQVITHLILDPEFSASLDFIHSLQVIFTGVSEPYDIHMVKEQLKRYLFQKGVDEDKTILLLIDEGQKLNESCLEILRELLNYETNTSKLLQIVIFAQTEFESIIKKHANFMDRINLYHRLAPLSFKDTRSLIQYRIEQSSIKQASFLCFTIPAIWAIYKASGGYPRKIIHLCHQSILAMIIQNKVKADWFLVHACIQRSLLNKSSLGSSRWRAAFLFLVLILVSLISWYDATVDHSTNITFDNDRRIDSPVSSPTKIELHEIQKKTSNEVQPIEKKQDKPQLVEESKIISPTTNEDTMPQVMPDMLGSLPVLRQDTVGKMIQHIYGAFKPKYLEKLLQANPQIQDPNTVEMYSKIHFPVLFQSQSDGFISYKWLQLSHFHQLDAAYGAFKKYSKNLPVRIISYWTKQDGLGFVIVMNTPFKDEMTVQQALNGLPEDIIKTASVVSWNTDMEFFCEF
ncbi:MAG: AAA family ATPase [Desulfobacterales bacterium]|nr:AAA family ATPase [Desulfobacterales bacterium]